MPEFYKVAVALESSSEQSIPEKLLLVLHLESSTTYFQTSQVKMETVEPIIQLEGW